MTELLSEAAANPSAVIAERRIAPRLKTLLTGVLVFDEKGTTMDCLVRRASAPAARNRATRSSRAAGTASGDSGILGGTPERIVRAHRLREVGRRSAGRVAT